MERVYNIAVISDTHMPRMAKRLPEELVKGLSGSDLIIHAGDWADESVYEELLNYAPVTGVSGNADAADITERFGPVERLSVGGCSIGVVHGHGRKGTTESRALAAFDGENPDCIIYGHSHIPVMKYAGSTLIFNPGSPTDKRRQPRYSYGLLKIEQGVLSARHVFFDSKL